MRIEVPEANSGHPVDGLNYLTPGLAAALSNFYEAAYRHSQMTLREFEAARIRTAEINGCQVCWNFRAGPEVQAFLEQSGVGGETVLTRGPIPDEALYANILDWRTASNYSDRERIVIELAEGLGLRPKELAQDDGFWARARKLLTDSEIADISLCIACWMGAGRVAHALGLDTVCLASAMPTREPA